MRCRRFMAAFVAASVTFLSACGGGGDSSGPAPPAPPPPPPPAAVNKAEAFRFLNQATFGATEAEAQRLIGLGDATNAYGRWIDAELMKAASMQLPEVQAVYATLPQPVNNIGQLHGTRVDMWFRNAVSGDDQLRQRVAWALSQIFVVGQSTLQGLPYAATDYYDMLARNAFANYRQLLEDVTLHPAMGVYLSMLGNQKPDAARNIRPDENYAREVMQLFAIGLVQLNLDGSVQRNTATQEPLPTYDQSVIEGFAHSFTGWRWAGAASFNQAGRATLASQVQKMQAYPEQHDVGAKKLLTYTGAALAEIPARNPAQPAQDLRDALDNIFNHPNVGPFISKQLIQRLAASNPSPAYVERVARVFNNNGSGVRGDLGAVVRAILLDTEARATPANANNGKLKEPVLRVTQLWRAYDGKAQSGKYINVNPVPNIGQGPLQAASVFNFYSPFYAPPGEISTQGLVAPELQIATEFQNTVLTNYLYGQVFGRNSTSTAGIGADTIVINIADEVALAADPPALVRKIADKLLGGQISDVLKTEAEAQVARYRASTATPAAGQTVAEALWQVVSSPEYAAQR
jgi:uncharacterized protein (DUF1800 family)